MMAASYLLRIGEEILSSLTITVTLAVPPRDVYKRQGPTYTNRRSSGQSSYGNPSTMRRYGSSAGRSSGSSVRGGSAVRSEGSSVRSSGSTYSRGTTSRCRNAIK